MSASLNSMIASKIASAGCKKSGEGVIDRSKRFECGCAHPGQSLIDRASRCDGGWCCWTSSLSAKNMGKEKQRGRFLPLYFRDSMRSRIYHS